MNAREQAKARVKEVLECETAMIEFSDATCERAAEAVVSGLERLVAEQETFYRPEPQLPGQTTIDEILAEDELYALRDDEMMDYREWAPDLQWDRDRTKIGELALRRVRERLDNDLAPRSHQAL